MKPYYENAALMLMTSLHEGFPMVLSEAYAYGIPVVMMRMGYLENAKHGCVIVPKNDVDAAAREMVKLLKSLSYRRQIGAEGLKGLDEFKVENTLKKWTNVFKNITLGKPTETYELANFDSIKRDEERGLQIYLDEQAQA